MRFSKLLVESGVTVRRTEGEADVTAVWADSRRCREGACFVAIPGSEQDGGDFISAALSAGASAVVCQDASRLPPDLRIAWAVVDDTRDALGRLAQAVHGWPARKLTCVGVTGTNGKSTVTHLIREILIRAGGKPGLVGTITYQTPRRTIPATMTTPDAADLAALCEEIVAAGGTHLVMEASSHALDQKRTAGIDFAVGVFTNLSGDHLDYHHTMEAYVAAKRKFFEALAPGATAVINRDDPLAEEFAAATSARVCWYGLSPLSDVQGRIEQIDDKGTVFDIVHAEGTVRVCTPLIGRHNVFNSLAAAAACRALGVGWNDIAAGLAEVRVVPGRLQRVPTGADWQVFVDYAHTDDALRNVLSALRPITTGRILVAFGCGGNRDATKRPRMARVAQELADRIVVTCDNPRNEDPQRILDDILAGLDDAGRAKTEVEPDRRRAIARIIEQARGGDIVVIAGKGHEDYQLMRGRKLHFDDVEVAQECIRNRKTAE